MTVIAATTREQHKALVEWAAARIPHVEPRDLAVGQAFAVMKGDRMQAVVVYHSYSARWSTIQVTAASDTRLWAHPDNLKAVLQYPFDVAQVNKLWTATPIDLEAVWRFDLHLGMKREAVLRDQFGPKRHAVICSMLKKEWRKSRWFTGGADGHR